MEFKVVRASDGRVMMQSSDKRCIYPDEIIRNMNKAGYKAYLDGKAYRPSKEAKRNA